MEDLTVGVRVVWEIIVGERVALARPAQDSCSAGKRFFTTFSDIPALHLEYVSSMLRL